jgi:LacI family transcriptional regulator of maltose regulon
MDFCCTGREADQLLQRLDMLLTQGVDGVIIAGERPVWAVCERAAAKGLVFASRLPPDMRPTQMRANADRTFIRRGHQRIAWLGGKSSSLTRAERVWDIAPR